MSFDIVIALNDMYRNREESRRVIALASIHYCTNKYVFIRRTKSKRSRRIRTNKILFCMRERALIADLTSTRFYTDRCRARTMAKTARAASRLPIN